jgi:hypothetical protein
MSDRPAVKIALTLASGGIIERVWTLGDMDTENFPDPAFLQRVDWLEGAARTWGRPEDPVLLTADVPAGREDDARRLLGVVPQVPFDFAEWGPGDEAK